MIQPDVGQTEEQQLPQHVAVNAHTRHAHTTRSSRLLPHRPSDYHIIVTIICIILILHNDMTRYTDNIVIYNILHTCYIARNDEDDTIRLCPFWNRENARHRYNV